MVEYKLFNLKYIMFLLAVLVWYLVPMKQSHFEEISKWEFLGFGADSGLPE